MSGQLDVLFCTTLAGGSTFLNLKMVFSVFQNYVVVFLIDVCQTCLSRLFLLHFPKFSVLSRGIQSKYEIIIAKN